MSDLVDRIRAQGVIFNSAALMVIADDAEEALGRAVPPGDVAELLAVLRECAEWLESRPGATEGDAATSSSARAVLEAWGQSESAARGGPQEPPAQEFKPIGETAGHPLTYGLAAPHTAPESRLCCYPGGSRYPKAVPSSQPVPELGYGPVAQMAIAEDDAGHTISLKDLADELGVSLEEPREAPPVTDALPSTDLAELLDDWIGEVDGTDEANRLLWKLLSALVTDALRTRTALAERVGVAREAGRGTL